MPTLEEHAESVISDFELWAKKRIDEYTVTAHARALERIDLLDRRLAAELQKTDQDVQAELLHLAHHEWIDHDNEPNRRKKVEGKYKVGRSPGGMLLHYREE